MAKSITKYLQFSKKVKEEIHDRDNGTCIFCAVLGKPSIIEDYERSLGYSILDVMHFIPKSQLGLGIAKNGAIGCRYHHHLLDNGNEDVREEYLKIFENYLRKCYPDWDKDKLVYKKYNF